MKCRIQADIAYAMLRRQRRQSTADHPTAKSKITDLFQRNTAETNDGVVELVCQSDPGGSEVELQDRELSSLACDIHVRIMCDECGDEQAVNLVTSPLSCDVNLITLRQPYHMTSEPPFPKSWLRPCHR